MSRRGVGLTGEEARPLRLDRTVTVGRRGRTTWRPEDPMRLEVDEMARLGGPDGAEGLVVATYLLHPRPGADVGAIARDVAATQSTGTWVELPGETEILRDRHAARVLSIDGEAPAWVVRIGFPRENVGGQIPLLLATVYGEAASAVEMRLVDLDLPPAFVAGFPGPHVGIAGIRERLGVAGRPLLITMVKPALGLSPEQSSDVVRAAALGGADLIKDDELLVSLPGSDPVARVRAHERALREVRDVTGHRAIYFVNVTDRPDRMVETARRAVDAGASGLMVDHLTTGTASLASLAEDPALDVPILAHFAFSAAVAGSARTGVASHIAVATLPRLAGADVLVCPSPYGSLRSTRDELLRVAGAATSPLGPIRPAWPMPGGGLHAGLVPVHLADLGIDHAFGAGGAVHGHPMGAAAGAAAIRQAFDAAVAGRPLADAAAEHAELAAALETWPEPAVLPSAGSAPDGAAAPMTRGGSAPDGPIPSEREW